MTTETSLLTPAESLRRGDRFQLGAEPVEVVATHLIRTDMGDRVHLVCDSTAGTAGMVAVAVAADYLFEVSQ